MSLLLFAWALSLSLHSEPNGVRMNSRLQSCQVHLDTLHKERSCTMPPAILRFALLMMWLIILNKVNLPNLLWQCVQRSQPSNWQHFAFTAERMKGRKQNPYFFLLLLPQWRKSQRWAKIDNEVEQMKPFLIKCVVVKIFFDVFVIGSISVVFYLHWKKKKKFQYIKKSKNKISQCWIKPWQLERKP